jgi:ABC-2 type transport system ATP-binding protein
MVIIKPITIPKVTGDSMFHVNGSTVVVEVKGVFKQIGNRPILENIHLEVPASMIYGISGHNGSGKSILLRVICGLVIPNEGIVRVFGKTIGKEQEFPHNTGALIETPGFLPGYSGMDNLRLLAMIRNQVTKDEIEEVIRKVGLDPFDRRPVRTYSTGMRQRLGLAQALMEKSKLLILDEPTSGLDRQGTTEFHQLFRDLRSDGITILLTSHSHDELKTLCNATFLMDKGHLEAEKIQT